MSCGESQVGQAWSARVKGVKAAGQGNYHAEKSVLATGAAQGMTSAWSWLTGSADSQGHSLAYPPASAMHHGSCSFFLTLW